MKHAFAALVFAAALSVAQTQASRAESPDPDARTVEQHFMRGIAAFNAGDLDTFLRQFHPEMRMFAVNKWIVGEAEIGERFRQTFLDFPKVRMEITNLKARSVAPEVVAVDFEFATFPRGDDAAFRGVGSGVDVNTADGWREVLEHETVTRRDPRLTPPVRP